MNAKGTGLGFHDSILDGPKSPRKDSNTYNTLHPLTTNLCKVILSVIHCLQLVILDKRSFARSLRAAGRMVQRVSCSEFSQW